MPDKHLHLFDDNLLLAHWSREYESFRATPQAAELHLRLKNWAAKKFEKETTAEASFVNVFFQKTWGYFLSGEKEAERGFTLWPKFPVQGSGSMGGTGSADLAVGFFGRKADGIAETPQALCEFKDIRSGLDDAQNRKGNTRSPVRQCADYLRHAYDAVHPSAAVKPAWGIVTDMNEFRLYHRSRMPAQYQRFVLLRGEGDGGVSLAHDTEDAALQRFLFFKLFQSGMLLAAGGASPLEKLLAEQYTHEKEIENEFYKEYRAYREKIFHTLVEANPDFQGTRGQLVRLAQRFLDRCIFILFCEDMGAALSYPPHLLRNLLISLSRDPYYDGGDEQAWTRVKKLFESMRDGSPFYEQKINRFNGGLFEPFPALESLRIPTRVFCARGQGENEEALLGRKDTLLYLSAAYNFGAKAQTHERSINLYTLGRIFEQSITELEFLEAEAENRESLAGLSKRKRDGVYYTPEWVTYAIVEETVGGRLAEMREEIGLAADPGFTEEEIGNYRTFLKDKRRAAKRVGQYLELLDRYARALDRIRVVDPACGSGAFLIQAFERLFRERRWIAGERERLTGDKRLFDQEQIMRAVLSHNIYGVDINPESVEITRLALWLHTALPDRPLTALEDNIRCGNSLIGSDFYRGKQIGLFSESEKERINVFDWGEAFPEIFANGGFDCVIGNPPYVKLQHFRKIQPDMAEYLTGAKKQNGEPLYFSTRTGNFDLYLPFIERGIELLNAKGRMGFIAPNLWVVNEYGQGLRSRLLGTRSLYRWIDFKDFQVFEESITYTALQFYKGSPSGDFKCLFAPKDEIGEVDWEKVTDSISYSELPDKEVWNFMPREEWTFINHLKKSCLPLGDPKVTRQIFQGLITSADHIFHLERIGNGRYLKTKPNKEEVPIEDALMKPLVSGAEAKRYQKPRTQTYLLFPYDLSGESPRLWSTKEMQHKFPKGWAYLKKNEKELRERERGKFNDEQWYRFGRNQNIDKQELPKLGVAQTVPGMRVFYDHPNGEFCFNNVRVNGILPRNPADAWFLLGVLNAPVADFVFRRIAKPKEGGYFEANKQFIAPLPIPPATEKQKKEVGKKAKKLQELHTQRRDLTEALESRLASGQTEDDKDFRKLVNADPALISPGLMRKSSFAVENLRGELRFLIDGAPVVQGVYVEETEADYYAAQWRHIARSMSLSETMTGERLIAALFKVRKTGNAALRSQVIKLDAEISALDARIDQAEKEMNDLVYSLYRLSEEERKIVEND